MTRRDFIILGKRMVLQYHVTVYRRSRNLSGHAIPYPQIWGPLGTGKVSKERRNIAAPFPPTTARQLYILAHEVAHVVLGHLEPENNKPSFVEEREAEDWAHAELRRLRVPVPKEETEGAEGYVAHHRRKYWKRMRRRPDGPERIEHDLKHGYITRDELECDLPPRLWPQLSDEERAKRIADIEDIMVERVRAEMARDKQD